MYEKVEILLERAKKTPLGFFPTPLHPMERLSEKFGYDIYCKRDDLTGFNTYGGNKIRKLEFLLEDAKNKGCDTVITYGATQLNHVMETISAARRCGLYPVVFLVSLVEPDANDIRANLFLDTLFDAEIHLVPANGELMAEASKRSKILAEKRMKELREKGHKCYEIPTGGANGIGSVGYIFGFLELTEQMAAIGKQAQYIFTSTGTGGTLAGLAAGKALTKSETNLIGIQVGPKDNTYGSHIAGIANDAIASMGINDVTVTEEMFHCDNRFYGAGYEIPSKQANEAIRYLAKTEGVLTDPVYTGKGFYGMLQYMKNEEIPKGSCVIFWHTGGTTALFAEHEIVGNLTGKEE